jgi:hypothetical protein
MKVNVGVVYKDYKAQFTIYAGDGKKTFKWLGESSRSQKNRSPRADQIGP